MLCDIGKRLQTAAWRTLPPPIYSEIHGEPKRSNGVKAVLPEGSIAMVRQRPEYPLGYTNGARELEDRQHDLAGAVTDRFKEVTEDLQEGSVR